MRQVGPPSRNAQQPHEIASQDVVNHLNRPPEERSSNVGFLDFPIDVLLEIFSYVEPVDLLHLSSASKYLLKLLRSDDTLYIWTLVRFFLSCPSPNLKCVIFQAYANISQSAQPPKCPDGVNIIHYTNFLYGEHCQVCSH